MAELRINTGLVTAAVRVRATRRKLIIQVATEIGDDGKSVLQWRDARMEDVTMTRREK